MVDYKEESETLTCPVAWGPCNSYEPLKIDHVNHLRNNTAGLVPLANALSDKLEPQKLETIRTCRCTRRQCILVELSETVPDKVSLHHLFTV